MSCWPEAALTDLQSFVTMSEQLKDVTGDTVVGMEYISVRNQLENWLAYYLKRSITVNRKSAAVKRRLETTDTGNVKKNNRGNGCVDLMPISMPAQSLNQKQKALKHVYANKSCSVVADCSCYDWPSLTASFISIFLGKVSSCSLKQLSWAFLTLTFFFFASYTANNVQGCCRIIKLAM